jgi:hypothetical protein
MTAPSATFLAFTQVGAREDLTDMIYRISPTEVPFTSSAAREKAQNVKHEWQIDKIAAAATNNQVAEGTNGANTAVTPTSRIFNYTEIPTYTFQVSGTAQAMNTAGRANELSYQLVMFGLRMKRDIEAAASGANGFAAGSTTAARVSASLESWMSTNWTTQNASPTSAASVGFVTGTGTTAPVDATTPATVTEANVKAMIRAAWTAGGRPDTILVGPYNKV